MRKKKNQQKQVPTNVLIKDKLKKIHLGVGPNIRYIEMLRGLSTPTAAQLSGGASFLQITWNQILTGFFNWGSFEQHQMRRSVGMFCDKA
jgi:hypothetical protein